MAINERNMISVCQDQWENLVSLNKLYNSSAGKVSLWLWTVLCWKVLEVPHLLLPVFEPVPAGYILQDNANIFPGNPQGEGKVSFKIRYRKNKCKGLEIILKSYNKHIFFFISGGRSDYKSLFGLLCCVHNLTCWSSHLKSRCSCFPDLVVERTVSFSPCLLSLESVMKLHDENIKGAGMFLPKSNQTLLSFLSQSRLWLCTFLYSLFDDCS